MRYSKLWESNQNFAGNGVKVLICKVCVANFIIYCTFSFHYESAVKSSYRKLKFSQVTFYGRAIETLPEMASKFRFAKFASQTLLLTVLPHCVAEARKNSNRKLKLPHRVFMGGVIKKQTSKRICDMLK